MVPLIQESALLSLISGYRYLLKEFETPKAISEVMNLRIACYTLLYKFFHSVYDKEKNAK